VVDVVVVVVDVVNLVRVVVATVARALLAVVGVRVIIAKKRLRRVRGKVRVKIVVRAIIIMLT